jgi:hypothetical protein
MPLVVLSKEILRSLRHLPIAAKTSVCKSIQFEQKQFVSFYTKNSFDFSQNALAINL